MTPSTKRSSCRAAALAIGAALLLASAPTPGMAQMQRHSWGGNWHGGGSWGGHWRGGGCWGCGGGGFWPGFAVGAGVAALGYGLAAPYYAAPPVYYAPPPVYYAPPPVYYAYPVYP